MDARSRSPYFGLAAVLLAALALQTYHMLRSPVPGADGITFIYIAQELPRGIVEVFRTQDQHPGFPAMLLAATRLVQWLGFRGEPESWMLGARIVTFVCGVLSVAVVWLLARDLFDVRVANLAAAAFAVLPLARIDASGGQSDTPHLFFFLLAAWLATSASEAFRPCRLAGASAAAGLAYWIRPEGLEVLIVAVAFVAALGYAQRWSVPRFGVAAAALAVPTVAVIAPYVLLSGKVTSKQQPLDRVQRLAEFVSEPAAAPGDSVNAKAPVAPSPPPRPVPTPPTGLARWPSKLLVVVVGIGQAIARFVACVCQGLRWVFVPIVLLGMVACVRARPRWRGFWFLVALASLHTAILLAVHIGAGYIAHRHVLPVVALAMPATGLGLLVVGEKLAARAKFPTTYAAWGVFGLCCLVVLPYTLSPFHREFLPVIDATRWVLERADEGSGIVCNSPYVAYYSPLPTIDLNSAPSVVASLAAAKDRDRYEYVVLHVGAHAYRPQWIEELAPYYRQVRSFPDPTCRANERKALVFQARNAHASRNGDEPQL